MKYIRNEDGVALAMVLIFAMVGLAITSAMLFMLTQGTMMSGSSKQFRSADEAGLGGTNLSVDMVKQRGIVAAVGVSNISLPYGLDACLQQKLATSRGWTTGATTAWTACNPTAARLTLDPTSGSDMTADLPGAPGTTFRTFTKIVDTVQGNTDASGLITSGAVLGGAGVVASATGMVTPPQIPYLYRIEVQTQDTANPQERSRYSVLYAY